MKNKDIQELLEAKFENYLAAGYNGDEITVYSSANLTFPDVITILHSLMLNYMNKTMEFAEGAISLEEEEEKEAVLQKIKEDIYDMVNCAASNVLQMFAPEIEARPDLTAEAILKAENEILDNVTTAKNKE